MRVILRDLKEAVPAMPLENSLPSLATQPTTNNVVMGRYVKGNPLYVRLMTPWSTSLLFQDSPSLLTYCIIFWDVIGFFFFLCAILSYTSFHLAFFALIWIIHVCWPSGCLLRKTFLTWQAYGILTFPVTWCSLSFRATLNTVLGLFNDLTDGWRVKMTVPPHQTNKMHKLPP